jgi:uncharacterized transporter YbjL
VRQNGLSIFLIGIVVTVVPLMLTLLIGRYLLRHGDDDTDQENRETVLAHRFDGLQSRLQTDHGDKAALTLGSGGGALLSGLLFGWYQARKPLSGNMPLAVSKPKERPRP